MPSRSDKPQWAAEWSYNWDRILCFVLASYSVTFFPEGNMRIWLCTTPTDMRKSYNGVSTLVKSHLNEIPLNGHLHVLVNRKCNQKKILFFDRNGYSIWGKRLEQGQFVVRASGTDKVTLSYVQLS